MASIPLRKDPALGYIITTDPTTAHGYHLQLGVASNTQENVLSVNKPVLITRLVIRKYTPDIIKVVQEMCDFTELGVFKEPANEHIMLSDKEAEIKQQCRNLILNQCAGVLHSLSLQFGSCNSTSIDSPVNLAYFPRLRNVELRFIHHSLPDRGIGIPSTIHNILCTTDMKFGDIQCLEIYIDFISTDERRSDDKKTQWDNENALKSIFQHGQWADVRNIVATYGSQSGGQFKLMLLPVDISEGGYKRLSNPADGWS